MRIQRILLAAALTVSLLLTGCALAETTVVCSFYPLRIFAENLLADVPDIRLETLAPAGTGCLHDFQLLPGDLRSLDGAACLVINGAGMEDAFLPLVQREMGGLPLVDCSQGIELIQEQDGPNPHIWLSTENARQMTENMCRRFGELMPEHAAKIRENTDAFQARLTALHDEIAAELADLPARDIVTFHEAYPYFAAEFGLHVVASVTTEPDEAPSPRMIAETVERIKTYAVCPLFSEPGVTADALEVIARETGQPVYELDPITGGSGLPEDFEAAMRRNADTIAEAFRKVFVTGE